MKIIDLLTKLFINFIFQLFSNLSLSSDFFPYSKNFLFLRVKQVKYLLDHKSLLHRVHSIPINPNVAVVQWFPIIRSVFTCISIRFLNFPLIIDYLIFTLLFCSTACFITYSLFFTSSTKSYSNYWLFFYSCYNTSYIFSNLNSNSSVD